MGWIMCVVIVGLVLLVFDQCCVDFGDLLILFGYICWCILQINYYNVFCFVIWVKQGDNFVCILFVSFGFIGDKLVCWQYGVD